MAVPIGAAFLLEGDAMGALLAKEAAKGEKPESGRAVVEFMLVDDEGNRVDIPAFEDIPDAGSIPKACEAVAKPTDEQATNIKAALDSLIDAMTASGLMKPGA